MQSLQFNRKNDAHLRALVAGAVLVMALGAVPAVPAGDLSIGKAKSERHSCCAPGADTKSTSVEATALEALEIPDLTFVRMDGTAVSLRDELATDKPVMLNFIFTTCTTICPVMSATFEQVQRNLGPEQKNVRMVSISIDPDHDTPARLREYARSHDAGSEWHFLTGTPSTVEAAQKAFGAYRGNKFNHAPVTFMRGAQDTHWLRVAGLKSARDLEAELHRLTAAE